MYGYIIGTVKEIEANYIILENNKIGYLIYVSNPYSFTLNEEYKIYIYTVVREDEYSLYGFKTSEEKDLFLRLISVKGMGPKMALPILEADSINSIKSAIESENINYLKKFPKIGDKVARQMILDLKGKLKVSENIQNNYSEEVIEALTSLGYRQADVKKIIQKVDSKLSVEQQIKEALKLLLK